ncbi:hypothetical protein EST38_g13245 [Candolleomyces aberdarensis]|uniref:Uncharacterized protein n=1 Tax=Candolleomyces aberdarensis TaxID=2316362 RepID=A0A4V1Q1S5_9AGAR|nr:hypothetical protein EST38_g13245 [Candolleomyces aberdarensis]
MDEQSSYQAQEAQSDAFLQGHETPGSSMFTMIYIDQSYTVSYNYHNSQNRTNTETINSHNLSSTQARNSSLNGDAGWTFQMRDLDPYTDFILRDRADSRRSSSLFGIYTVFNSIVLNRERKPGSS